MQQSNARTLTHKQATPLQNDSTADHPLDSTVVISKAYLDQLLKSSFTGAQINGKDTFTISEMADPKGAIVSSTPLPHSLPTQRNQSSSSNKPTTTRCPSPPTEEYFPFGRPGCGAPLRTDSGKVMADLRQRVRGRVDPKVPKLHQQHPQPQHVVAPEPAQATVGGIGRPSQNSKQVEMGSPRYNRGTGPQVEMGSPRYARGAGPHVDQYALRDKEQKRKKELEHVVSLLEMRGIFNFITCSFIRNT